MKTVVITGVSTGIGFAAVRFLFQRDFKSSEVCDRRKVQFD
jgi:NAD(P)-dependent dehydrogenase (short-subunit alcohol dehydrogenase family)